MSKELKQLVLFGAGGMGREIARLVEKINHVSPTYDLMGFIDDDETKWGHAFNDVLVIGGFDWLVKHREDVYCVCTVGFPHVRKHLHERMLENGIQTVSLISPDTKIDRTSTVGTGAIIASHCIISVNCEIGTGVFINSLSIVGHDTKIGDYVVCNPRVQISGGCEIGNVVSIGGMCFLNPKVRVGENVVIAPMSCVYGKVKAGIHIMGNPAHKIEL